MVYVTHLDRNCGIALSLSSRQPDVIRWPEKKIIYWNKFLAADCKQEHGNRCD